MDSDLFDQYIETTVDSDNYNNSGKENQIIFNSSKQMKARKEQFHKIETFMESELCKQNF